jgi:acyl carrier protein
MTEAEIYRAIKEMFSDIFMRDDLVLSADLSANDVDGWDSVKQIEIIIATEGRFGIEFTTQEIDQLENVGELVRLIELKAN